MTSFCKPPGKQGLWLAHGSGRFWGQNAVRAGFAGTRAVAWVAEGTGGLHPAHGLDAREGAEREMEAVRAQRPYTFLSTLLELIYPVEELLD